MRIASRLSAVEESATLKVTRRASELRAAGRKLWSFGAGEPDFDSPAVAVAAAQEALSEGFTKYTPATGIPELKSALAERYQRDHQAPWGSDQFMITVGGKAALFELALSLFEEGDEVVIPAPCWVSFPDQIRLAGAMPVLVPMSKDDGFRIRPEPILEALTPNTRAIIVNSPCNPTGGILEAEDLETLVAAAAEADIVVITDETYEFFLYDGRSYASGAALASRYPETIVLVGSFSKTYAMTGWRIGYAAGPREVIGAASRVQGHATSNPTSFAMKGALAALEGAEPQVQEMVAEFEIRRDLIVDKLSQLPGLSCLPPAGAFYVFPDISGLKAHGFSGSLEVTDFFLEEANVAVVPGIAFGNDDHLRLSFACSRENIEEGLQAMRDALARRLNVGV